MEKTKKYLVLTPEPLSEYDIKLLGEDVADDEKVLWKEEGTRDTLWEAAKLKREIYDKTGVIAKIVPC